jgi:hypothetical protein
VVSERERQFHLDMVRGVDRLKREIGYTATRFSQMLGEQGGVETAHRLLTGRDASDGFTTLWEHRRLDMSLEAFVLLPWYQELFTDDERSTAERRLRDHEFNVDAFLARSNAAWPAWALEQPGGDA